MLSHADFKPDCNSEMDVACTFRVMRNSEAEPSDHVGQLDLEQAGR